MTHEFDLHIRPTVSGIGVKAIIPGILIPKPVGIKADSKLQYKML